jgi:hypothetical protein
MAIEEDLSGVRELCGSLIYHSEADFKASQKLAGDLGRIMA